jgi:hypothetical protein
MPEHEVAHALMAPMIFLSLHQHSLGACAGPHSPRLDPVRLIRTHLDLALRGLEVRPATARVRAAPRKPASARKKASKR